MHQFDRGPMARYSSPMLTAVHPNHELISYEEGFAQMTICKTGNSLQVMGLAQSLRWVFPNEMGVAQNLTSITGNSLQSKLMRILRTHP